MEYNNTKPRRSIRRHGEIYHYYYKKSGLYKTLFFNILKLIIIASLFISIVYLLNHFFKDSQDIIVTWVKSIHWWHVFFVFFFSEAFLLGIIPCDLFIIWADSFKYNYLILFFLGTASYLAGIVSYFIGIRIGKFPIINNWIIKRQKRTVKSIHKWGGAFIIIAAILPLPWTPAIILTGIINYPFKKLIFFALSRFIRFYLYGLILFRFINLF